MTRKKNQSGPEPIEMVINGRSKKHGYFPDTYPGGYEVFDHGDKHTVEYLPRDGTCDRTMIIRSYKTNASTLLAEMGFGHRPSPEEIVQFLKKYPSKRREREILSIMPGVDIKYLPVDYSTYTDKQLRDIATDSKTDDITFLDIDNELIRRAKKRSGKNE
jgi:hypothetical protein